VAFSVRRFVAYFAVFAALVSAGVIGLVESQRVERYSPRSPSVQATRLASAMALLVRRDSIVRALRSAPARPGLSIVLPAAAAPRDRAAIDAMIHRFWRDAVGDSARIPVIVLVTADAGRLPYPDVHPASADYVLLPSLTDGRACVVVLGTTLVGGPTPIRNVGITGTMMRRHAGACAFLAKYGAPGAAMTRWLASSGWDPASFAVVGRDSAYLPDRRSAREELPPRSSGAMARRYYYSDDDFAVDARRISCVAGRDAMCTPSEGQRNRYRPRGATWATTLVPAGVLAFPARYWGTQQTPDDALLSIVERAIGRERFAALWTTERPIPDAIRDAAGAPLGELVKRTLLHDMRPVAATPWPTPIEWLVNLGLIGALIGFVTRTRRHSA